MAQFPLDETGKTSLADIRETVQSRHDYRSRNMELFFGGRKRKKVIFKSTVINFLTLVRSARSQNTCRASMLDFQQIPRKNQGRNEKINPK